MNPLEYIFKKEKIGAKRIITLFGIQFSYTKKKRFGRLFENRLRSSEHAQKKLLDKELYARSGYHINFDAPKTFNEKLNWLKLYWQHPLITLHADKYTVRDIVKDKVGEKYLIPLLGVWDTPEEIDFAQLPDQFVLKVNWGCGQNSIVTDKSLVDEKAVRQSLGEWLKPENNNYWHTLEWGYKNIQPRIIAERYIKALDSDLPCYKFMCFNGEPQLVQVVYNDKRKSAMADYFDMQWNILPFKQNLPNNPSPCAMPANFQEMCEIAKTLAKPFPFVRVDLFNLDGTIYFSECTFYSNAGTAPFTPSEWDRKLGDMLRLPEKHTEKIREDILKVNKQNYKRERGTTAVVNYPMPSMTIGITNQCTNKCLFCSYHSEDAREKSKVYTIPFTLSLIDFRKIVDMAYNGYVPRVHICGTGEPFMHKDILAMIDYVAAIYGKASFQTNFCKPLFEKHNYLDAILKRKEKISYITTDLLSGDPELHNTIKRGSKFDDVLDTLTVISANSSIPIMISCILTKHNYATLADLVHILSQRKIYAHLDIVNLFSYDFNEHTSSSIVYCSSDTAITEELKKVKALGRKLHIPVTIPSPCDDGRKHCTVFWDKIQTWPVKGTAPGRGHENIVPHACRAVVLGELASLGYVFDYDTVMDLWNNEALVQIRSNLLQGLFPSEECRYCPSSGSKSVYRQKETWSASARKNLENFEKSGMVAALSASSLCIDCGANVGTVTEVMAQTGATVHAFEPHPVAFKALQSKFANTPAVILHQQAVLDKKDSLKLFMYKSSSNDPLFWSQGASLYAGKDDVDGNDYVHVAAIDLVEFINNLGRDIDILKLDVEGAEYDILLKLIANDLHTKIRHILVETHDRHIPDIIPQGDIVRGLIREKNITNINLEWV